MRLIVKMFAERLKLHAFIRIVEGQILKRFEQCKIEFSHLKADLSEEELLALAKPIIKRKK